MKAVIQRVREASVSIDNKIVGQINQGLTILLAIHNDDTDKELDWVVNKIVNLRIFSNDSGQFDLSAMDIDAEILLVSQFTLYGDCKKGRRPSFTNSAQPDKAIPLYEKAIEKFKATGLKVETGEFGADMLVDIKNDGPVTLIVERQTGD